MKSKSLIVINVNEFLEMTCSNVDTLKYDLQYCLRQVHLFYFIFFLSNEISLSLNLYNNYSKKKR